MTTDVEQAQPQKSAAEMVIAQVRGPRFKEQLEAALPPTIPPQRFVRAVSTALMTNPEIVLRDSRGNDCDLGSFYQAALKCAASGLMPDGHEAALVRYKSKVSFLPMIGGYRKIAADHGWMIRTQVVYENDHLEYEYGLKPVLIHRPVRPGEDQGKMVAAYAVAAHRDGRAEMLVMHEPEILEAKKASNYDAVWKSRPDRMWEKTVGKRLFLKLAIGSLNEIEKLLLQADQEVEPVDATVAMYGEQARATFERPAQARQLAQGTPAETPADTTAESPSEPSETERSGSPAQAGSAPSGGEPEQEELGGTEGADGNRSEPGVAEPPATDEDSPVTPSGDTVPAEAEEPPEPPEPEEPPQPAAEAEMTLEQALAFQVPKRREGRREDLRYAGWTVERVEAKDPKWLDWTVELPEGNFRADFLLAVRTVVAARGHS